MNELLTLFTRASKLLRAAADEAMSAHGVRVGQNIVLEVLWATDGLTPSEVAQHTQLATPTVVNTATRMERDGLLVRGRDPHDARLVRLYLTDHGRSIRAAVEQARDDLADRATATLTDAERRHLTRALAKIAGALQPPGPA